MCRHLDVVRIMMLRMRKHGKGLRGIPAMLVAICWQSEMRGEPSEDWFSKVESPQSLTLLRASRLEATGEAAVAARRAAITGRSWNCILMNLFLGLDD